MNTGLVRKLKTVVPQALQRDALAKYKIDPEKLYSIMSARFQKWLGLFFIERGNYKITNRGYEELSASLRRMDTAFGESCSDRERSGKEEVIRALSKKESRVAVNEMVSRMLGEGKAEELYTKGQITYMADWTDRRTRILVIKKLVETLGKNLRTFTKKEFRDNRLGGMLLAYYADSPYRAFVEAGYAYTLEQTLEHARTGEFQTEKIYPWEMKKAAIDYNDVENRVAAIMWHVWKLSKKVIKVIEDVYKVGVEIQDSEQKDFEDNGLMGLLVRPEYNSSHYLAFVEAGLAYSVKDSLEHAAKRNFKEDKKYFWEFGKMPTGLPNEMENRVAAMTWLIWKLNGKKGWETTEEIIDIITNLSVENVRNNGLGGLLANRYQDSPYLALVELQLAYSFKEALEHAKTGEFQTEKIYPWEMKNSPYLFEYNKKENRVAATKWLVWKLRGEKEVGEIKYQEFMTNGLAGVMDYYDSSATLALIEAELLPQPSLRTYPRSQNGVATL